MSRPPRVALVADARHPIAEPFAGGLQSQTWHLARGLRERGVEVTVFAAPGSDSGLGARFLDVPDWQVSERARVDVSMPSEKWMQEHHAYLGLVLDLAREGRVDVVHNNSLHHLPVAMAEVIGRPVLTTLHTPPTPWLESAISLGTPEQSFVAVSRSTARAWQHAIGRIPPVVLNGIDHRVWRAGPGGPDLVWTGRICPEKGPHLAIDIARLAGRRLRLAGPISDRAYWQQEILPRLGGDVEHVGHLAQRDLAALVGRSAMCLVTPMWDEPYGLVAAEALACGTPVLGFRRGGLEEVVTAGCARLVDGGDVEAAAALVDEVAALDRAGAREHAVRACSVDTMVDRYVELYGELDAGSVTAA